jgi:hypothetical protein
LYGANDPRAIDNDQDRRGEITLLDRASTPAVAGLPAYPHADLAKRRSNFHNYFEDMGRALIDPPS